MFSSSNVGWRLFTRLSVKAMLIGFSMMTARAAEPQGGVSVGREVIQPHTGARLSASSSAEGHGASLASDGKGMDAYAWLSNGGGDEQWLQLDFPREVKISEIQLHSGVSSLRSTVLTSAEFQIKDGGDWRKVAEFSGAWRPERQVSIPGGPVTTRSVRLWTREKAQIAVRELALYPETAGLGDGITFYEADRHQVSVNQVAYNQGAPKRFTVPTAMAEDLQFEISTAGSTKVLFSGKTHDGFGDFSDWTPKESDQEYVIRVKGGSLDLGVSYPFAVGPDALQRSLLQPMVDFMIDARSLVGTHPSGYGGAAWRDGSYFTHELASLGMLYMAFPEEVERMPRQISWQSDRARVLDPNFKLVRTRLDTGIYEAVIAYYNRFEAPADDAPDLVKLIHWGAGMTLTKPVIMDPSGDGIGRLIHPQSVEQLAYVLVLQPRLEKWLPKSFFSEVRSFVEAEWSRAQLFATQAEWNPDGYQTTDDPEQTLTGGTAATPYKGRHAPGHSILPNLLMYEAARRQNMQGADQYLDAAVQQAAYVMRFMDWTDPRHTKGQRMSEHKTITGLVWLLQNYPRHAPDGLKQNLERWADIAISRSGNPWDFRRYDLGRNWSIPKMNEPGNLAGFPACALSVSWMIEDSGKKQRLREIAYAGLDCLFGRNPLNAASPFDPQLGWNGKIEKGWPIAFANGTTARLETCRGSLSSSPGSEMFPFNPRGALRHPEGWTAFNSALNVGISYLTFDNRSRATAPPDCLKPLD